jgi:hypothetical protein
MLAMNPTAPKKLHPDAALLDSLGGPAAVARALGLNKRTGTQTVQNWKYRGIPELTLLKNPKVFKAPKPLVGVSAEEGVANAA